MKKIYTLIIVALFFSCSSNKFKIEKKAVVDFKEAYFQKWTAGVKGGGAGFSVILISSNSKKVQLDGVYFRDYFAKLKFHEPNKYQGFVKTNENSKGNTVSLDGTDVKQPQVEKVKIPVELKQNEAVIAYKDKGKIKHFKVTLKEKQMMLVPR